MKKLLSFGIAGVLAAQQSANKKVEADAVYASTVTTIRFPEWASTSTNKGMLTIVPEQDWRVVLVLGEDGNPLSICRMDTGKQRCYAVAR